MPTHPSSQSPKSFYFLFLFLIVLLPLRLGSFHSFSHLLTLLPNSSHFVCFSLTVVPVLSHQLFFSSFAFALSRLSLLNIIFLGVDCIYNLYNVLHLLQYFCLFDALCLPLPLGIFVFHCLSFLLFPTHINAS